MADRSDQLVRALPLIAMLAAVALTSSQLFAWWGVERAASTANRGETDLLLQTLDQYIESLDHAPDTADLESFLASHEERGLRYAALMHPGGRIEAGVARLPDPVAPERFSERRGRVRASRFQPPPRNAHRPREGPWNHKPPPPRRIEGDEPRLVVEVLPRVGAQLRSDALRTLIASGVAALLFVLFAFALRRAIRQRERAMARLHRDRQLAALGEMSAVLAHEIRNPLASLKGHAQLLVELLPDEGKPRAKAARVVDEAQRLEELTTNLLEFVRSGELQPESVDFRSIVRCAAERAEVTEMELPADPIPGTADGARLQEALLNVFDNALQASGSPAEVELRADADQVVIRVMDRGPGIDEDAAAEIFEPFKTTKARGTGLGLAITKSIVEAHRGTIAVGARPGGGAVFSITLPRAGAG